MSGLIFEGNTAKRFGETIPRIFIDRVEVLPQDNIKINISLYFAVPKDEETIQSFIEDMKTKSSLKVLLSLCNAASFNVLKNSRDFLGSTRPGTVGLSNVNTFQNTIINFSDLFETQNVYFDIYNKNGDRFLKVNKDINFALDPEKKVTYVVGFVYNDVNVSFTNKYRSFQTSDLSYEKIFDIDGTISNDRIVAFKELDGNFYYQTPLYTTGRTYHKTDDFGHLNILNAVSNIVSKYQLDESNRVSLVLTKFSDSPELLVELSRVIDLFTNKSSTTQVGQFYREMFNYIRTANELIASQESLIKEEFINTKIKDLRQTAVLPLDESSSKESDRPDLFVDADFFPTPLLSRSLFAFYTGRFGTYDKSIGEKIVTVDALLEDAADSLSDEDLTTQEVRESLYNYFAIETNGFYFFDFEKALNYKSKISDFFNPYNLIQIFGRGSLANFFKITAVQVSTKTRHATSGMFEVSNFYSYNTEEQKTLRTAASFQTEGRGELKGVIGEYFPEIAAAGGGTYGGDYLSFPVDKEVTFYDSLHQRGFNTVDGLGGYRLACFEFNETQKLSTPALSDKQYVGRVLIEDKTMQFYDIHIRQKMFDLRDKLNEYLDFADDFCSFNNIEGRFNDFFVNAIKEKFEQPYVWEEAPIYNILIRQLLAASYVDGDSGGYAVRKRDASLINMESAREKILADIKSISPDTGDLELLRRFVLAFALLTTIFEKNQGLDISNSIYKPSDFSSEPPFTTEQRLLAERSEDPLRTGSTIGSRTTGRSTALGSATQSTIVIGSGARAGGSLTEGREPIISRPSTTTPTTSATVRENAGYSLVYPMQELVFENTITSEVEDIIDTCEFDEIDVDRQAMAAVVAEQGERNAAAAATAEAEGEAATCQSIKSTWSLAMGVILDDIVYIGSNNPVVGYQGQEAQQTQLRLARQYKSIKCKQNYKTGNIDKTALEEYGGNELIYRFGVYPRNV
jgi:hypothetical protein